MLVRSIYLSVEQAMRGWVSAVANYSEPVDAACPASYPGLSCSNISWKHGAGDVSHTASVVSRAVRIDQKLSVDAPSATTPSIAAEPAISTPLMKSSAW